ncbi:MAG: hypothetical protein ACD_57C00390G0002, partial [uncultured bacterium]
MTKLIPARPPKRLSFSQKYFLGVVVPLVTLFLFGTVTLTASWPVKLSPEIAEIFQSSTCIYPP